MADQVRPTGESRRLVGMTSFGQIPARASLGRNDGEQGKGTPASRSLHNSVRRFTTEPVTPQQRPLVHRGAGHSTTASVGSPRSRLFHNSVRHASESRRLVGMTSFGQIPARASLGRNDGEQGKGIPASRLLHNSVRHSGECRNPVFSKGWTPAFAGVTNF